MKAITYILACALFMLAGCAHSKKNSAEFEGMHGKNKIRVFVQVQADLTDPHCEGSKCRQKIVQSARERCAMLLAALIRYKNNGKKTMPKREDIANAVDSPVIKTINCNELLCCGLVDFNVSDEISGTIRNTEVTRTNDSKAVGNLDVSRDD